MLYTHQLYFNPKKYAFLTEKVEFIGHIVGHHYIKMDHKMDPCPMYETLLTLQVQLLMSCEGMLGTFYLVSSKDWCRVGYYLLQWC